jgi:glycosyltransferase involved in cell wall biosynthesis
MKVSIITVVYNGAATIAQAVESVLGQDYPDLEYIVIDGASKDTTLAILEGYRDRISVLLSEPDKGIYDAMNKGLQRATGDIVGILNADDLYAHPRVIRHVVDAMNRSQADTLYADLTYFKGDNPEEVIRFYSGKSFRLKRFEVGDMPPHPTFFVRRNCYAQHGMFDTSYRICADFELMLRFLYKEKLRAHYLPEVLVRMRAGGISDGGWRGRHRVNLEIQRGMRQNGLPAPMWKIYGKYFQKIWQLLRRPKASTEKGI